MLRFFRMDILKFHDFFMILALFSNSMIFPGLQNGFFSFSRFSMIFQAVGNPAKLYIPSEQILKLCRPMWKIYIIIDREAGR